MITSTIVRDSTVQTKIQALGSVGTSSGSTAITVDVNLGSYITAKSNGATTWTFNSPGIDAAYSAEWKMTLQNGGAFPQAWTNVKWAGGSVALTSTGYDVLGFVRESASVIRGYIISKDSR